MHTKLLISFLFTYTIFSCQSAFALDFGTVLNSTLDVLEAVTEEQNKRATPAPSSNQGSKRTIVNIDAELSASRKSAVEAIKHYEQALSPYTETDGIENLDILKRVQAKRLQLREVYNTEDYDLIYNTANELYQLTNQFSTEAKSYTAKTVKTAQVPPVKNNSNRRGKYGLYFGDGLGKVAEKCTPYDPTIFICQHQSGFNFTVVTGLKPQLVKRIIRKLGEYTDNELDKYLGQLQRKYTLLVKPSNADIKTFNHGYGQTDLEYIFENTKPNSTDPRFIMLTVAGSLGGKNIHIEYLDENLGKQKIKRKQVNRAINDDL
ncbi:hypothetical protein [Terasakiella pusilla]|uniref:hypothetical protein n=1 Tax=Terasakiella pusilla TaxID=64973 RepID=UPI003AA8B1B6